MIRSFLPRLREADSADACLTSFASCARPATHNAAHCGAGEPVVTGIGLAAAEQIMFSGITSLPERATFCQARKATEASTAAIFGSASQQLASTTAAWNAVGVPTAC